MQLLFPKPKAPTLSPKGPPASQLQAVRRAPQASARGYTRYGFPHPKSNVCTMGTAAELGTRVARRPTSRPPNAPGGCQLWQPPLECPGSLLVVERCRASSPRIISREHREARSAGLARRFAARIAALLVQDATHVNGHRKRHTFGRRKWHTPDRALRRERSGRSRGRSGVPAAHDPPPSRRLSASAARAAVGWMVFDSSMCLRIR